MRSLPLPRMDVSGDENDGVKLKTKIKGAGFGTELGMSLNGCAGHGYR